MNTCDKLPPQSFAHNSLKHDFSLGQAQIVVAGVFGRDLSNIHVADALRPQLLDPTSILSIVMRRNRLDFDPTKLLMKLESLPLEKLKALQHLLGAVTALHPLELFYGDLPSVHVLRRFGLAPPVDTPIWGFVFVETDGGHHVDEIVLPVELALSYSENLSAEQLAQAVICRTYELRDGTVLSPDPLIYRLCYELAHVFDSRFFRVIEGEEGRVSILQVPIEALRSDVLDGSLRGLVIPGVNASPCSGT